MNGEFPIPLQLQILTLLCYSTNASALIRNAVTPRMFAAAGQRRLVERIYTYLDTFRCPPLTHTVDLIEELVEDGSDRSTPPEVYAELAEQIADLRDTVNEDFVISQLNTFVSDQALRTGIVRASEAVQAGNLEEAKTALNTALRTQVSSFTPGLRLIEGLDRLNEETRSGLLPLGIKPLDDAQLGPARGELHLFIAPPKRGKCIAADELVLLPNGKQTRIADVVRDKDKRVLAMDPESGQMKVTSVTEHWTNGKKPCVRLTTKTGRRIVTTKEHLYFTEKHVWIPVDELRPKVDRIAVPRNLVNLGQKKEDPCKLRVLGYVLADGHMNGPRPWLSKGSDRTIAKDFCKCIRMAFGDSVTRSCDGEVYYVVNNYRKKNRHNSCHTADWFESLGLANKLSKEKTIPDFVFQLRDELIAEFLRALFSCDGSIYGSGKTAVIEYSSASAKMAEQVYHLLLRLGVVGKFHYGVGHFQGKVYPGYGAVHIKDRTNILRYITRIGFTGKKMTIAKRLKPLLEDDHGRGTRSLYGCRSWTDDFLFDQVVKIEDVGERETFDLTVPEHENFIVSDMVAHNSWELIHIGKQALLRRLNVVHITLEISERLIVQRYLQSLFSIQRTKAQVNITRLRLDSLGRVELLDREILRNVPAFRDTGARKILSGKLQRFNAKDRLVVKAFPTGGLTIQQLRNYLDLLERAQHFTPDVLIIDYPDLMKLGTDNYRLELGSIFKELRGIAVERNLICATATQSNRAGSTAKLLTDAHTAEDYSKIATADTVLTYSQTSTERELGLARIYASNTRVGEDDRFVTLITQAYKIGQFSLSAALLPSTYDSHLESLISRSHRDLRQEEDGQEDPSAT